MRGSSTAARTLTLLLFLTLVGVCTYWALQILAPRPAIAPSGSIGDSTAAPNLTHPAQLFGSVDATAPIAAAAPSNIQVNGIAEAGPRGVVILTVDGKPAAAFAVNDTVTDGTTVKSVALDKVTLDQRGRLIELKTPDRSSVTVLSSGVGKSRSGNAVTASPVPTRSPAPLPGPQAVAPPAGTQPGVPPGPPSSPNAVMPPPAPRPGPLSAQMLPPPGAPTGIDTSVTNPAATTPATLQPGVQIQGMGPAGQPAFPPPMGGPGTMAVPGQVAQPPGMPTTR